MKRFRVLSLMVALVLVLSTGCSLLTGSGDIEGQVVDNLDGDGVKATIEVWQGEEKVAETETDDEGSFLVGKLTPGAYTVKAIVDGITLAEGVTVEKNEVTWVELIYEVSMGGIEGQLVDNVGDGLEGTIEAWLGSEKRASVATDEDGNFVFADLRVGVYTLKAVGEGLNVSKEVTVTKDEVATVTLTQEVLTSVTVQVTDAVGTPLPGVAFTVNGDSMISGADPISVTQLALGSSVDLAFSWFGFEDSVEKVVAENKAINLAVPVISDIDLDFASPDDLDAIRAMDAGDTVLPWDGSEVAVGNGYLFSAKPFDPEANWWVQNAGVQTIGMYEDSLVIVRFSLTQEGAGLRLLSRWDETWSGFSVNATSTAIESMCWLAGSGTPGPDRLTADGLEPGVEYELALNVVGDTATLFVDGDVVHDWKWSDLHGGDLPTEGNITMFFTHERVQIHDLKVYIPQG